MSCYTLEQNHVKPASKAKFMDRFQTKHLQTSTKPNASQILLF